MYPTLYILPLSIPIGVQAEQHFGYLVHRRQCCFFSDFGGVDDVVVFEPQKKSANSHGYFLPPYIAKMPYL